MNIIRDLLAARLGMQSELRFRGRLLSIVAFLLAAIVMQFPAWGQEPIRIGLTDVALVNDGAQELWAKYLERTLGRPVLFVVRRSYADIQQLLRLGDIDFGWICGYPYVIDESRGSARYVATPEINGRPTYRILLIVPQGSPRASISDLKGQVFAFSDPDSVSFRSVVGGFVDHQSPILDLNSFFATYFFTYSHVNTVQAVADGLADGGSVDGQVWEILSRLAPDVTQKTRVIAQSELYGLPPIVASSRVPEETLILMRKILTEMVSEPEGERILAELHVDRFTVQSNALYASIRNGPAATNQISGEIGRGFQAQ